MLAILCWLQHVDCNSTATGTTRARSGRGWLTTLRRFHHLGYERVSMLIAQDECHFAGECRKVINNCFASSSGLSRTMAISISPPSFWIMVGRAACISARIATALFSHRVRSHSSSTLCARVSVCGGAFRAAGVPNACMKGLFGGMRGGKCRMADTAR